METGEEEPDDALGVDELAVADQGVDAGERHALDDPDLNFTQTYKLEQVSGGKSKVLADKVPVSECEVLERAVGAAAACARPGETVLLSPACASFDQFRDYEARGEAFRSLVEALG